MFKSSNPILTKLDNNKDLLDSKTMTINGTISKTFVLLLIAMISGSAVLHQALAGAADKVTSIMGISLVVGLIAGFVTIFARSLAKFTSPIYAFAEGALLAGLSLMFEQQFPGIVVQAVSGTFITFFIMLILYRTGVIKATEKFRSVLLTSMFTIFALYLIQIIGSFFNFSIPFVSGNAPMSILFSGIVVVVASLNLILDFDFIEQGVQNSLAKDTEWYAAFGLMVTLIWLYIEILNLLDYMVIER